MATMLNVRQMGSVCRACLRRKHDSEYKSLEEEPTRGIFIRSTHIYVEYDQRLPQRLCKMCLEKCVSFLEFRDMAENNDRLVRSIVEEAGHESVEDALMEVQADMPMEDPIVEVKVAESYEVYVPKIEVQASEEDDVDGDIAEDDNADSEFLLETAESDSIPLRKLLPEENNSTPIVWNLQPGEDPVLPCPVKECAEECHGFKKFESHLLKTHVGQKSSRVCPICGIKYERMENLRNHFYLHTNQKFKCSMCDKIFNRPKTLTDHMRHSHLAYTKKGLDELLMDEDQVDSHVVLPGPSQKKKRKKGKDSEDDEDEDEGGGEAAVFSDAFMNSLRDSPMICPVCQRDCRTFKSFEEHIFTHISRLHRSCPLCQKTFKRFDNLKCHIYCHTDITFECQNCPRTFVNPKTFSKHVRMDHVNKLQSTEGNEHVCPYCPKSFIDSGGLREHLKVHTGEKKYPCPLCSEAFTVKVLLREHIENTHKKLECGFCKESFKNEESLRKHYKSAHPEESVLCPICGEMLASKVQLTLHKAKKHPKAQQTQHVCEDCGKEFPTTTGLKEHQFVHSGARPYSCTECPLSFRRIRNLKAHLKMHESEVKSE